MSSPCVIVPYAGTDEAALLEAWNDTMVADPINRLAWRRRFLLDPHFLPDACLLAKDGAAVAGFVFGMRPAGSGTGWIVAFGVRPKWRRQNIAFNLLAELTRSWQADGVSRIDVGPYIPTYIAPGVDEKAYADGVSFLTKSGFDVTSRPISMRAVLSDVLPNASVRARERELVAEGIHVREATAADIVALRAFMATAFPYWQDEVLPVMTDLFTTNTGTTTLTLALDGEQIIGFAQSRGERFGPFGVRPERRGGGIGGVLLNRALEAMFALGNHVAWFLWAEEAVSRLYRRHGFVPVRQFSIMGKSLPPPDRTAG